KQPIHGDVLTAPVLVEGQVYITTLDGTLSCFRQQDGQPLWQELKNATSSPVVWKGQCYFSQRQEEPAGAAGQPHVQQMEWLAAKAAVAGSPTDPFPGTRSPADYLDYAKRLRRSPHFAAYGAYDAAVGFAASKGAAEMEQRPRRHAALRRPVYQGGVLEA